MREDGYSRVSRFSKKLEVVGLSSSFLSTIYPSTGCFQAILADAVRVWYGYMCRYFFCGMVLLFIPHSISRLTACLYTAVFQLRNIDRISVSVVSLYPIKLQLYMSL